MKLLSIDDELNLMPKKQAKNYMVLFKGNNYEMGVGRAGCYEGHSHYSLTDLLFSPNGITCETKDVELNFSRLLVVPRKTYMPKVSIGNFFFLKFSTIRQNIIIPDKTTEVFVEGSIGSYFSRASLEFPWYLPATDRFGKIEVTLDNLNLILCFDGQRSIRIE